MNQVVQEAGVNIQDVKLIIPHQANQRILDAACEALNLPPERMFSNVARYGNTSAASVPIALCEAVEAGRLADGDLVTFVGFGAGLTWAAALVRWGTVESPAWPHATRAWIQVQWMATRWRVRQFFHVVGSRLARLRRRAGLREPEEKSDQDGQL